MRSEFWTQAVGTTLVGLVCGVSLALYDGFVRIYQPSSAVPLGSLRFIAQKMPNRPEPRSALPARRLDEIARLLPPDLTWTSFVRTRLTIRVRDRLRLEEVLFVGDNFRAVTGASARVGAAVGDNIEGTTPPCWVSPWFARRYAVRDATLLGESLVSGGTSCIVAGVLWDDSGYWIGDAAIVARVSDWRSFPGKPVPESRDGNAVHVLVRTAQRARSDASTLSSVLAAASPDDLPLHVVPVPTYLFDHDTRIAARFALVSAAWSAVLAAAMAAGWFLYDVGLHRGTARIHWMLGASASAFVLSSARRRASATIAGGVVLWLANTAWAAAVAPTSPGHTQRGPGSRVALVVLIIAGVTAWSLLTQYRSAGNFSLAEARGLRGLRVFAMHGSVPAAVIIAVSYLSSYRAAVDVPLGIDPQNLLWYALRVQPGTSDALLAAELEDLQRNLSAVPGAAGASFADSNPILDDGLTSSITVEGVGRFLNGMADHVTPGRKTVGPNYFSTLGIPVHAGRECRWSDSAASPRVAMVNAMAATTYWKGEEVLGRRIKFGRVREAEAWATIVGVVANVRHEGYRGAVKPEVYLCLPLQERGRPWFVGLLIRTTGTANLRQVEHLVLGARSVLEVEQRARLSDTLSVGVRELHTTSISFVTVAITALLTYVAAAVALATIEVKRSARDFGLMLALGARKSTVVATLLRRMARWRVPAGIAGVFAGVSFVYLARHFDYGLLPPAWAHIVLAFAAPTAALQLAVAAVCHQTSEQHLVALLRTD